MSDPFANIMTALSMGQDITRSMGQFNHSQGSKLAWEKAHLDAQRWAEELADQDHSNASLEQPEKYLAAASGNLPLGQGDVESSSQVGLTGRAEGAAVAVVDRPALQVGNPVKSSQLNSLHAAGPQTNAATVAQRYGATPTTRPSATTHLYKPPQSMAEPRSVRLFLSQAGVDVVVRDANMDASMLRKLVERVHAVAGPLGARVNKIVLNGLVAWEDAAIEQPAIKGDADERIIEISL
jgi:hypothetical protein